MWSAGVVLFFMLCGDLPFLDTDESSAILKIQQAKYDFKALPWKSVSPNCKHLISSLLTPVPEPRYTAERSLTHPWFSQPLESRIVASTLSVNVEQGKVLFNHRRRERGPTSNAESDHSPSKRPRGTPVVHGDPQSA